MLTADLQRMIDTLRVATTDLPQGFASAPIPDEWEFRVTAYAVVPPHVPSCVALMLIGKIGAGDKRFGRRWFPPLEDHELAIAETLWRGGSVRRLRVIVERLLAYREQHART